MDRTIAVHKSTEKKTKTAADQLGFGKVFTDHMFIMEYNAAIGWHQPRIVPYQPITLDPAAKVFHYGQTVFEGMKAYEAPDGRILTFRPDQNIKRLNLSNDRLSIPPVDEEMYLEAVRQLVLIDRDWMPSGIENSLYIRPFVIATEATLGVSPSLEYKFMVILSAVGSYYEEGIHPVKIYVESEYVRAVAGGVGAAKTAGNYAAGLKAQQEAGSEGYSQVMWLDGVHHKYIEEVGSMNVFFRIGDTVVTPALNGSILAGVTRNSVLHLLNDWNVKVEERAISIDELAAAWESGELIEAFGTGTAAVISPIGELGWQGRKMVLGDGRTGELSRKIYETLTGIQRGTLPDSFGWTVELRD
ncbi:branched-chain amino acid aminotransferase [Paenibacillaceae bacterium]|nr:branched-chain amino acid aminotransferase [Paenibacillaceae bacterium]